MANKDFVLDNGVAVTIYKRRGGRNLRLSISAQGKVRVTIPAWAPYKAGLDFAKSRQDWIADQKQAPKMLVNNQPIGKAHHIHFEQVPSQTRISTRVLDTVIIIKYPAAYTMTSTEVQKAASEASIKAMRKQAENLLPQRLATLANIYDFEYADVSVKRLKGRWGSCDQHSNIILNLFLMQLPWSLIDYVLLHELTHTRILRHGPDFWEEMEKVLPTVKDVRKAIKQHHPVLNG